MHKPSEDVPVSNTSWIKTPLTAVDLLASSLWCITLRWPESFQLAGHLQAGYGSSVVGRRAAHSAVVLRKDKDAENSCVAYVIAESKWYARRQSSGAALIISFLDAGQKHQGPKWSLCQLQGIWHNPHSHMLVHARWSQTYTHTQPECHRV